MWKALLPADVRAGIAGMDLKEDFDKVVEKADEIFLATKPTAVAAVAAVKKGKVDPSTGATNKKAEQSAVSADLDTSADASAFDKMNQLTAELAAFNKNFKKRGRGGKRGGKG